jgi:hypothetical protein
MGLTSVIFSFVFHWEKAERGLIKIKLRQICMDTKI